MASQDQHSGGYKKPPERTQFKPGQSGNPKGRPPKSRSMAKLLQSILFEKVRMKVQGRTHIRTALEVMLIAALAKAAKGDNAARKNLMNVMDLSGLVDALPEPPQGRKNAVVICPEAFKPWLWESEESEVAAGKANGDPTTGSASERSTHNEPEAHPAAPDSDQAESA